MTPGDIIFICWCIVAYGVLLFGVLWGWADAGIGAALVVLVLGGAFVTMFTAAIYSISWGA